jgi:hypothetical protein
MPTWETLYCANHPDRIAIERCEVCRKPLCAYCLYYTEDGQRLCAEHAETARLSGVRIEEPTAYAEQLIGAQAGIAGKHKRGQDADDGTLYKGNSHDLLSLIGMLIGVISVGACCGIGYCLPGVGLVVSLVALINARHAYNPRRTRKLSLVGLLFSGLWVALVAACILMYGVSIRTFTTNLQNPNFWQQTYPYTPYPTLTPTTESIPTSTPHSADPADTQASLPPN